MPKTKLIHGDCLEVLPRLRDCSVDFILTDPPFGHGNNDGDLIANWEKALGRPSKNGSDAPRPIANDKQDADPIFRRALKHFHRLLRTGGCCCCCCGGGGPDPQFARWSLWIDKVLDFKQMVIWDKGPMGMGWHYRRSYETVLVASKPGGKCRWFDTSGKIENIIRPGAYGLQGGVNKILPRSNEHPTAKPLQLAAHFIRLHTQEGDTVLDPFMGAGWAGIACKQLNRNFIGIEIDDHWFRVAQRRIESACPGMLAVSDVPHDEPEHEPNALFD